MIEVVLVNERDEPVGLMEKMAAHRSPHLHRAFSVFLFTAQGEMLLQQRAFSKYHSGGLWTNACCSHPYPGEEVKAAADRRLKEEMGIEAALVKAFHFVYKADFDNGLHEHEFDHVFIGEYEGPVYPNEQEVVAYCYKSLPEIKEEVKLYPGRYTEWFKIALPFLERHLNGLQVSAIS